MGSVATRGRCLCGSGLKARRCCGGRNGSATTSLPRADERSKPDPLLPPAWSTEELTSLQGRQRGPFDQAEPCPQLVDDAVIDGGAAGGAIAAYRAAAESGHPDHAPQAAFDLGRLLEEQGDV